MIVDVAVFTVPVLVAFAKLNVPVVLRFVTVGEDVPATCEALVHTVSCPAVGADEVEIEPPLPVGHAVMHEEPKQNALDAEVLVVDAFVAQMFVE